MTSRHDRGLRAVERVRGLQEKGRRLALAQANRDLAAADEAVLRTRQYEDIVAEQAPPASPMAYLTRLAQFDGAVEASATAADLHERAEMSSYESQQEWSKAKAELSAIENLLERRAEARAAERRRQEIREADELSQRTRAGAHLRGGTR